ncbi:MAG: pentapeptide repeat-containing protein [Cyanobacteria bacterium P01_D01_bin.128]
MAWHPRQLTRRLEKSIQRIPTWLAVLVSVLCLAAIALWVEGEAVQYTAEGLWQRKTLKLFFDNAESFAIVAAVILYFKGAPDRKAQKHYEAWRVIDNAAAAKVFTSYARLQALQDLHKDGVSLRAIEAPKANLASIHLPDADMTEANLSGVDLRQADLHRANLSGANLQRADLRTANLRGINLTGANLQRANLQNANLNGANLRNANLSGADLRGTELWKATFLEANLTDADFKWAELQGPELHGAKLHRTTLPDGSVEHRALEFWSDGSIRPIFDGGSEP